MLCELTNPHSLELLFHWRAPMLVALVLFGQLASVSSGPWLWIDEPLPLRTGPPGRPPIWTRGRLPGVPLSCLVSHQRGANAATLLRDAPRSACPASASLSRWTSPRVRQGLFVSLANPAALASPQRLGLLLLDRPPPGSHDALFEPGQSVGQQAVCALTRLLTGSVLRGEQPTATAQRLLMLAEALLQVLSDLETHIMPEARPAGPPPTPATVVEEVTSTRRYVAQPFGTASLPAGTGSEYECYICLNEYSDGEDLRTLPCRHGGLGMAPALCHQRRRPRQGALCPQEPPHPWRQAPLPHRLHRHLVDHHAWSVPAVPRRRRRARCCWTGGAGAARHSVGRLEPRAGEPVMARIGGH